MAAHICLRNGAFSYGRREIFGGLSLDLAAGERLCLLGPNGCGKTTLLRCLGGILKLREGHLLLNGREAAFLSETERARLVGFVFQEHTVHFPYSVLDIAQMGRAPHLGFFATPSLQDARIALRALETVGIAHLQDQRYTEISGGERQLALIARALAQEPEVLLLDEPTSHLDFGNQILILETINRLAHDEGMAIMMATHFPDHALLASSQAVLMKAGGFIAAGLPQQVITEENLQRLYGVSVKVVGVDGRASRRSAVVPMLSELTTLERENEPGRVPLL